MKRKASITFIVILIILAIGPLFIPIPPIENALSPRELADPDSQFIEIDGIDVHYKMWGSGETTFILLHGFASSVFTWREVAEPLSAWGRVIAFDRPAYGLTERVTEWEAGENPYTQEAQLANITGLMNALGVESAVFVGNSAGGTIAMSYALANPDRVSSLILLDPAVYAGGGAPPFVQPLLSLPQFDRVGPLIVRRFLGEANSANLLELAWHDPSKVTDEVIEGYTRAYQIENWDTALWEFTVASEQSSLAEQLDELTIPTLVITGDDDRIVPTEDSIRLAEELPNAVLVVIPNSGHVPQEETPSDVLNAIEANLDFLQIR